MRFTTLLPLLPFALAAPDEPCLGPDGVAGVCTTSAACSSAGGTTSTGNCPADGADILCCTKTTCGSGGNCRWTSDCGGSAEPNLCPGPSQMQCCDTTETGWGEYAAPAIPGVENSCDPIATAGAETVVAALPGRTREVFCIRDCACPGTSDHCCGLAIDFMCGDAGGAATLSGIEIAEWVMNNAADMSVTYIIFGQKIWSLGSDAVGPWTGWRTMEDRLDITQNHWDHVHVSFSG